jgi:hypothetical protein
MNRAVPKKHRLAAAAIAVVTIVAMFVAPFCGSVCAAMNGCASATTVSESGAEDCHHAAISSGDAAAPLALGSPTTCNRPELRATLSVKRNWPQTERAQSSAPHDSIAAIKEHAFSLGQSRARWRDANAIGSRDIPASTTILQI